MFFPAPAFWQRPSGFGTGVRAKPISSSGCGNSAFHHSERLKISSWNFIISSFHHSVFLKGTKFHHFIISSFWKVVNFIISSFHHSERSSFHQKEKSYYVKNVSSPNVAGLVKAQLKSVLARSKLVDRLIPSAKPPREREFRKFRRRFECPTIICGLGFERFGTRNGKVHFLALRFCRA